MNEDNHYWLFSSAAQSIAALVAFLLAGIALAFSMMDRLAEQDETLQEVVEALKRKQHKQLTALAIATGAAILLSLFALYLNPCSTGLRSVVRFIAVLFDVGAVVGSIAFVAAIVRPSKYSIAAKKEYDATRKTLEAVPGQEPSSMFFREFIDLEQDIRSYLQDSQLYVPSRGVPRMSFSFRQMIDALYQNERISRNARDLLLEVNKFRNLLFHGHMDQVDEGVLKALQKAKATWEKAKKEVAQRDVPPDR
jgi:hypothetical protein